MASYAETLVLYDQELYENVVIRIQIPSMKRIEERNDKFAKLLAKAIYDVPSRKNLENWYGTKVLYVGTSADDLTINVDGDVVFQTKEQIKKLYES